MHLGGVAKQRGVYAGFSVSRLFRVLIMAANRSMRQGCSERSLLLEQFIFLVELDELECGSSSVALLFGKFVVLHGELATRQFSRVSMLPAPFFAAITHLVETALSGLLVPLTHGSVWMLCKPVLSCNVQQKTDSRLCSSESSASRQTRSPWPFLRPVCGLLGWRLRGGRCSALAQHNSTGTH